MRLDNVQLRYSRRGPLVLAGVDATFSPGQVAVILGRNGAGKSTMLQVAAGVLRPDRGSVVGRPSIVGWVPERFPADQPFTVRRYLRGMAAIRGVRLADTVIGGWAERLGFDGYLDERLAVLSKGTAQKIGLAQALLAQPGLLVLDEPWEGLDAQTREEIPAIVAEVAGDGGIVLISDHQGEMANLPDVTAWLLAGGRLTTAAATFRAASAVTGSTPLWASPTMQAQVVTSERTLNGTQTVRADQARKPAREGGDERRWVVEVAVSAADPDAAVETLRTAGHEVLAVREKERA